MWTTDTTYESATRRILSDGFLQSASIEQATPIFVIYKHCI